MWPWAVTSVHIMYTSYSPSPHQSFCLGVLELLWANYRAYQIISMGHSVSVMLNYQNMYDTLIATVNVNFDNPMAAGLVELMFYR